MASAKDVQDLKYGWICDPCWDIEESEGFEENREELKAFRLEMEAQWQREREAKLRDYAGKIGLDMNLKLAEHLQAMERRMDELETLIALRSGR